MLAQSEEEGLGDDFYSRLCEGITRCTALRRVVIFRYDSARRRILAAGSFGVDLALFAGDFFTLESAALAREALEQDRVLEISEDLERPAAGASTSSGCSARTVVCSPMSARGRWLGRDPRRPRRRRAAADRVRARGAVDPRQDGRARGDGARRDAPARARRRARAADRPRARGPRGRRAAAVRRLARALRRPAVRRGDAPALRRGGAGGARATCAPRCSGRSGARRRRRKTTLAEEVARLRHEYPDLGIDARGRRRGSRRRQRSSRSPSRCSPRRSATPHKHAARDARRRPHRDRTTARSCSR